MSGHRFPGFIIVVLTGLAIVGCGATEYEQAAQQTASGSGSDQDASVTASETQAPDPQPPAVTDTACR